VVAISPEVKEWIQLVLDTLTALGTVGAVIVALRLAQSERREVVRVRAGIRQVVHMGQRFDEGAKIVNIGVTNHTLRPVTVTGIGWRVGIVRRQHFLQVPSTADSLSAKLPTKLEYGEHANYNFPYDSFIGRSETITSHVSIFFPWLSARFVRVEVSTSGIPGQFSARADHALGVAFVEHARELRTRDKA